MRLFNSRDENIETIFKNENAFLADFLPERIIHRDKEIEELASILSIAIDNRKPENVIIYGPVGTGKTATVRYVSRELENSSKNIYCVYINCWENKSQQSILSKIALSIGLFIPRRGVSIDEIRDKIIKKLDKEGKVLVVILDEIDILIVNNEEGCLYDLCRFPENFKIKTGIISVTNGLNLIYKLDNRIKSSLQQKCIEFRKYNSQQLKNILNERAKIGFLPGVIGEDVIALCAAYSAKSGGDARLAISLLRKAGLNCERDGKNKIEINHIKDAIKSIELPELSKPIGAASSKNIPPKDVSSKKVYSKMGGLQKMDNPQKLGEKLGEKLGDIEIGILKLLNSGDKTAGQIYNNLCKEYNTSERTVRRYLTKLEKISVITGKIISIKPKGKTKLYKLFNKK